MSDGGMAAACGGVAGSNEASSIASDAPLSVVVRADASAASLAALDVSVDAISDSAEDGSSDADISGADAAACEDAALGPTGMTIGRAIGTGGATDEADGSEAAADAAADDTGSVEDAASEGCDDAPSADEAAADDSPDEGSAEDGSADEGCADDASAEDAASDDGASVDERSTCDDGAIDDEASSELCSGGGTRSTLTAGGSAGSGSPIRGSTSQTSSIVCSATEIAAVATIRRSRGGGTAVRASGTASLMAATLPRGSRRMRGLAFRPRLRHCRPMRLDTFLLALSTFFATLGPADMVLVYAALTERNTRAERQLFAARGALIATGILLFFAIFGQALLGLFGITLPALRIAGGVLLLLISIDMVFARHSGGTGTTPEEENEARTRPDISVFPLATPLIAGPGAISATILLATPAGLFTLGWFEVVAAMLAILLLCYLAMLVAIPIQRLLGLTGLTVVSRVVGVLLAALAMQFLIDGIKSAGLFGA